VLYPQVLNNIRLENKLTDIQLACAQSIGKKLSVKLGSEYRVLIRESGTEPLLRVMVEGEDGYSVDQAVKELVEEIRSIL
jgi:phosphoglucosamine mutase